MTTPLKALVLTDELRHRLRIVEIAAAQWVSSHPSSDVLDQPLLDLAATLRTEIKKQTAARDDRLAAVRTCTVTVPVVARTRRREAG